MYKNLIIVDDEITTAFCLKDVVAWNNYGLTVAGVFKSAAAALKYMEDHTVDVIFSDIRMPHMDGIEFCKIIRENYPDILFVFISAYSDFNYAKKAIGYNAFGYITKPIDMAELEGLCAKIQEHLNKTHTSIPPEILRCHKLLSEYLTDNATAAQLEAKIRRENLPNAFLTDRCLHIYVSFKKIFDNSSSLSNFTLDSVYAIVLNALITPQIFTVPLTFSIHGFDVLVFSSGDTEWKELSFTLHKKVSEISMNNVESIFSLSVINSYDNLDAFKKGSNISARLSTPKAQKSYFAALSAAAYISNNYMKDISLLDVAEHLNITPYKLSDVLKMELNTSFKALLSKMRIEQAKQLLATSEYTNDEIARMVGFGNSPKYFYHLFKEQTGMTPNHFRKH